MPRRTREKVGRRSSAAHRSASSSSSSHSLYELDLENTASAEFHIPQTTTTPVATRIKAVDNNRGGGGGGRSIAVAEEEERSGGTEWGVVIASTDFVGSSRRTLPLRALESRRAVALSPSSIEFAHFYANLLYESATDDRGYKEVLQECERALSISDPIDPARESLQDEALHKLSSPEVRIGQVRQELSNIASLSTLMKNLGGGAGAGEEKFRVIPMRHLSDDPMEVRLVPAGGLERTPHAPDLVVVVLEFSSDRRGGAVSAPATSTGGGP